MYSYSTNRKIKCHSDLALLIEDSTEYQFYIDILCYNSYCKSGH